MKYGCLAAQRIHVVFFWVSSLVYPVTLPVHFDQIINMHPSAIRHDRGEFGVYLSLVLLIRLMDIVSG